MQELVENRKKIGRNVQKLINRQKDIEIGRKQAGIGRKQAEIYRNRQKMYRNKRKWQKTGINIWSIGRKGLNLVKQVEIGRNGFKQAENRWKSVEMSRNEQNFVEKIEMGRKQVEI